MRLPIDGDSDMDEFTLELIRETLRNGPMPEEDVFEIAGLDLEEEPDALTETGEVWVTPDGRAVLQAEALAGITMCHRLTQDNIDAGEIHDDVDFAALSYVNDEGKYGFPLEVPSGANLGDLMVVRVCDGEFDCSLVSDSDVGAGTDEAAALRRAFDIRFGPRDRGEVDPLILDLRADHAELFSRPVTPVRELLHDAGLQLSGKFAIGNAGEPWDMINNRNGSARIDDIMAELDLEDCCESALMKVLDEWALPEPNADNVRRELTHRGAAVALAKWSSPIFDGARWLDRFTQSLSDSDTTTDIKTFLFAKVAELDHDDATARTLYTASLASPDSDIREQSALYLARELSVHGDFLETLQMLRAGDCLTNERALLESFASPHLGRNDLCHCGSGKKFKQCHLNSNELDDAQRLHWLHVRIAEFMANNALANWLEVLDDRVVQQYVDEFSPEMCDDDKRLLRVVLSVTLEVWRLGSEKDSVIDRNGVERSVRNMPDSLSPGQAVIARFIETNGGFVNFGTVFPVKTGAEEEARALVANSPSTIDLLRFHYSD